MSCSVRYNSAVVTALLDSLLSHFAGIFANFHISGRSLSEDPTSKPFGRIYYLLVLDSKYGLAWLEDDHPGDEESKCTIREYIIGKIFTLLDCFIEIVCQFSA